MDKTSWDLSPIYKSFDDISFINDKKELKECIKKLTAYLSSGEKHSLIQTAEKYISQMNTIGDMSSRLNEYCLLRLSENSADSDAAKQLDSVNDIISEMSVPQAAFINMLSKENNIEGLINSSDSLKEHSFFIKEACLKAKHTLSENEELLYSKMQNTGSAAWEKLWESITSNLLCHVKTENGIVDMPLSETRNMAYESDRNLRRNAYEAEIDSLKTIASQSAFALNAIKGEVINICAIRNYSSPLEMTILDSRMDNDIFDAMLSSVKKLSPYFEKYFNKKAQILGLNGGLPFYDLFAPIGQSDKTYSYKEAKKLITESFYSFSQDLGDFAQKAFDKNWIDVFPKKGKTGGAFCSHIHSIGESRILTNFTGSFSDVVTIAHELGHGFHGEMLKMETYLNSDYPMPIAETASTFCECIIKNALLEKAHKDEAILIMESDVSDSAQIIVDILSRFIFEDTVFKKRTEGFLSADELCEIMLSAQKQTYGKGLSLYHPYMWVCKPHYYDAQYNYYNFPYAFGLLLARGLYSMYREDKKAFPEKYKKFLTLTGKASIKDTAKSIGIDLTDSAFWDLSSEAIKNDIDKFCGL